MTEENKLSRAERRRQEKEGKEPPQEPEDYGPVAPRTYDKCPNCGCPARFTVEAMKGDMPLRDIEDLMSTVGKEPALFSFEYDYQSPTHKIKLIVVGDSCVRCGMFYTLARDKLKANPFILPGHAG